jgi:dihydrodipicolinate synthase/N-acetylneuraminate lyase
MKPLAAHEIRGNWATLLCCWNDNETLDRTRLADEIDALVASRVDGIYSNGTAGEFHAQTEEEFDAISELLAAGCESGGVAFQIGASHPCASTSIERVRRAARRRPSAIQVILPDWFPVTDEEAVAFLTDAAEAADGIGLVLYNPPHAKRVLTPREYARLKERVPSLVGVKCAGGDEAWFAQMRDACDGLSVFVPGHLLASGVAQGAHGAYSNVACLNPAAAQAWTDAMLTDADAALELEARIRRFMDEHIAPFITEQRYANPACDRLLANIGRWADVGERMRRPYRWIPAEEADRLRPIAHDLVPEFVRSAR